MFVSTFLQARDLWRSALFEDEIILFLLTCLYLWKNYINIVNPCLNAPAHDKILPIADTIFFVAWGLAGSPWSLAWRSKLKSLKGCLEVPEGWLEAPNTGWKLLSLARGHWGLDGSCWGLVRGLKVWLKGTGAWLLALKAWLETD